MNSSTNIDHISTGKKAFKSKISYRYIKIVLSLSFLEIFACIILGVIFYSPLLQLLGFLEISHFIYLFLIFKANFKLSNTPDLQYDYGTGKYTDLSVLSKIVIYSLIAIYFIGLFLFSMLYMQNINYDYIAAIPTIALISLLLIATAIVKYNLLKSYSIKIHLNIIEDKIKNKLYLQLEFQILALLFLSYIIFFITKINIYSIQLVITLIYSFVIFFSIIGKAGGALNNVLDENLPESILYDFLSVVIENHQSFCEYKSMRTRRSGDNIFLEIDLVMHSDTTIEEAYKLEMKILNELKSKYPNAIPRIYISPCKKNCIYKDNAKCPIIKNKESK